MKKTVERGVSGKVLWRNDWEREEKDSVGEVKLGRK